MNCKDPCNTSARVQFPGWKFKKQSECRMKLNELKAKTGGQLKRSDGSTRIYTHAHEQIVRHHRGLPSAERCRNERGNRTPQSPLDNNVSATHFRAANK